VRLQLSPLTPAQLPVLPFDIVWGAVVGGQFESQTPERGFVGDFAVETAPTQQGVGGFQARNPIESAVIMLLFSDKRCAAAQLKLGLGGDRRGWPGDGFDVDTANGEAALGSLLWLDRRTVLNDRTAAQVAADAKAALQPLIVQQVCVEANTTATIISKALGNVRLGVQLVGRDGTEVYAGKFGPLWARVGT
jgi:phage gp46-like protein